MSIKEVIQLMSTYRCANTITSLRGATYWPFSLDNQPVNLRRVGTITDTGLLDWTTGLNYWTTGLDYWTDPNCIIQLVQCRTEAKISHFLSYFTNTAPYSIFPGVSRGQRSHAYLISFTFGGYAWIQLSSNKLWAPMSCINRKVTHLLEKAPSPSFQLRN